MTQEELNVEIAEHLGWRFELIGRSWLRWVVKDPNGKLIHETRHCGHDKKDFHNLIPNYINELKTKMITPP